VYDVCFMVSASGLALVLLVALAPGTPVRLQLDTAETLNGRLVSSDVSDLWVDVAGGERSRFPRESIARLEALTPRRQTVRGAAIGAAWFTLLGVGLFHCPPEPELPPCRPMGEVAAIWASVGAVSGAAFGSLIRSRDWRLVSSHRVHVAVVPRRRGLAVTLAVPF
jgi:hypothetical protein